MSRVRLLCFAVFFWCVLAASGEGGISAFTAQKIDEFLDLRMRLTECATNAEALEKVAAFEREYKAALPAHARDVVQETLIFDSLFLMQRYNYQIDPAKTRVALRAEMNAQMKKNEEWLKAHGERAASKWLLLFTGDVTSFYMTRSVAATFRHGLRVKSLYEKAIAADGGLSFALVNLGNWYFYAPKVFGGGKNTAMEKYTAAMRGARVDGEKYYAALHVSQLYFEKSNAKRAEEYLAIATALAPKSKEVANIRRCNANGISLFQYERTMSGIDEKMQESEMDDDDR